MYGGLGGQTCLAHDILVSYRLRFEGYRLLVPNILDPHTFNFYNMIDLNYSL